MPLSGAPARDVVAPVDAFHAGARDLGVPVIHVRSTLRVGGVDDVAGRKSAWRLVFPLHVGAIGNSDAHAIEGTRWTEFVTEVDERDLVVSGKKRLSAFYPTDLDFLLRNMGVGTLVLDGCLADCCVLNTAFEASNLGYRWSSRATSWPAPIRISKMPRCGSSPCMSASSRTGPSC